MTVDTAILLLAPADEGLAEAVGREADRLAGALGSADVVVYDRTEDAPDRGASWTVAVEVHGAVGQFTTAAAGLAERLGPSLAVEESLVVVGEDRVFFERDAGGSPVKLFYALYPTGGVTPTEFSAHWAEIHSQFVLTSRFVRQYHQLHADRAATEAAAAAVGFGSPEVVGVAHELFEATASFLAAGQADMADELADIYSISDQTRNRGVITSARR